MANANGVSIASLYGDAMSHREKRWRRKDKNRFDRRRSPFPINKVRNLNKIAAVIFWGNCGHGKPHEAVGNVVFAGRWMETDDEETYGF